MLGHKLLQLRTHTLSGVPPPYRRQPAARYLSSSVRPRATGGTPPPPPVDKRRPVRDDDGDDSGNGVSWRPFWGVGFGAAVTVLTTASPAQAASEIESYVDTLLDAAGPMLSNLGVSGIFGFVAAKAAKMVANALAVALGLAFIAFQYASYKGYITVNWTHIEEKIKRKLDRDNNGILNRDDAKKWLHEGLGILSQGVPSVAGFLLGFTLGLK